MHVGTLNEFSIVWNTEYGQKVTLDFTNLEHSSTSRYIHWKSIDKKAPVYTPLFFQAN
jgi:hypothetical protein